MIESVLLLLENNMNEEAIIIARSVLNNYFLIGYLLNDPDKKHIEEFHMQPVITNLYYLKSVKEMLNGPFGKLVSEKGGKFKFTEDDVNKRIQENEMLLKSKGYKMNTKPLSIRKLAEYGDEKGFELYTAYYTEASKFEHSDMMSLDIYKYPICDEYSKNAVFLLDMNRTDESLQDMIMVIITTSYMDTFSKLIEHIKNNEPELMASFNEKELMAIMLQIINYAN